jgi:ethanolamine ammonia-lyase small subunit
MSLPEPRSNSTAKDLFSDSVRALQDRTPARILVGRAGAAYRTGTQLDLRKDHAFAADAVHAELALETWGKDLAVHHKIFEAHTQAENKAQYLVRPDLGRVFSSASRDALLRNCPKGTDLQIAIGDGLSAAAVAAQVPILLPLLTEEARARGYSLGRPFAVRYCRVGILNEIGELLDPAVIVLLIGERPGLATAESLSAYMAYRPRPGHSDAQRNLISNIHCRGVKPEAVVPRILALAAKMMALQTSGVSVKEDLTIEYAAAQSRLPAPARRPEGPR